MRPTSLHLPSSMIKRLDGLVKAGIYPSRAEAVRHMVSRAIFEDIALLNKLEDLRLKKPRNEGGHSVMVTLKMPVGLLSLIEEAMRVEGFTNRSEYVRMILANYVVKLFSRLQEEGNDE